jgi:calcium channel MID1
MPLDDSCQVIFNLPFCTTIAHAVPSSPRFKENTTALATLYDDQAASYFANFSKSLAQIPCNTTSTAQYSLARTCTDCATAYKAWLCAVLMPRCEDFSVPDPWLQPRNIRASFANGSTPLLPPNQHKMKGMEPERWGFSRSRNPMIDETIKPGPYKELLPCEDLCFDIVRSCPAGLGFACPVGKMLKKQQYGVRAVKEGDEDKKKLRCSFPGAVVDLNTAKNGGGKVRAEWGYLVAVVVTLVGLCL